MDACPSSRPRGFGAQAPRRRLPIAGPVAVAAMLCVVAWPDRLPAAEPRDPLAQAVIDSLESEPRTTPEELLEATILASDVDAFELASSFLAEFVEVMAAMGDERDARLADLAELDPVGLVRTKRRLGARDAVAAGARPAA